MEPIVSSETSAIRTQTPGNYPKRNKLHLEHGESLKTISEVDMRALNFDGMSGSFVIPLRLVMDKTVVKLLPVLQHNILY